MKTISLVTLSLLISVAACSHHRKGCCSKDGCPKTEKSCCKADHCDKEMHKAVMKKEEVKKEEKK